MGVLERTTPPLPAFCLPITSLVQLAGEVVWISHRRGLGMPRHRKTRLLHWPVNRLLFLIRVLGWKQIVSFSNREQGVFTFYSMTFSQTLTATQTADIWVLKTLNWRERESPYILLAHTSPFSRSWPALFLSWGKSSSQPFFFLLTNLSLCFLFLSASIHFLLFLLVHHVQGYLLPIQAYLCQLFYLTKLPFIDQSNQTGSHQVHQYSWGFLSVRMWLDFHSTKSLRNY